MRLKFRSYDGRKAVSIGHGDECVGVQFLDETGAIGGIVFTPDEAHAFGTRLIQQARAARTTNPG